MRIKCSQKLACFPIIKKDFPSFVSRNQKLPIMTEVYTTSISCRMMPWEILGSYSSKISSFVFVYYDLIVRWLPCKELATGMHCRRCNCVHLRLRNMLSNNRNAKFPNKQFFIIWTANKLYVVQEGYGVNSAQMWLILHLFCACVEVKLHNLLIARTTQERILSFTWWMKFHTKW